MSCTGRDPTRSTSRRAPRRRCIVENSARVRTSYRSAASPETSSSGGRGRRFFRARTQIFSSVRTRRVMGKFTAAREEKRSRVSGRPTRARGRSCAHRDPSSASSRSPRRTFRDAGRVVPPRRPRAARPGARSGRSGRNGRRAPMSRRRSRRRYSSFPAARAPRRRSRARARARVRERGGVPRRPRAAWRRPWRRHKRRGGRTRCGGTGR
mmetsp:Transcript_26342/g.60684  ORF Transcript_26342/g.60684 Transcript_26342/m.60684 type:complete len:210 (+) Transcript_26342:1094-1723(+)